jgi:ferredoxin-type protein NapH
MFRGFWLLLPVSVLFFGRAFCGWACPGGLANQLIGTFAPLKLRVKNTFVRLLPFAQYLGLAVALYLYFVLGQPRADIPIRVGESFNSVVHTFERAGQLWIFRTYFVLGFLALGLIVANALCRFACPTGSLLEAAKGMAVFRFYKTAQCNDCNPCLRACEMGTRPDEVNYANCGDCLSVCPTDAIPFGHKKLS